MTPGRDGVKRGMSPVGRPRDRATNATSSLRVDLDAQDIAPKAVVLGGTI